MPTYDFMNTITIEAPSEEVAMDIYYASTQHLTINLSEMEVK
jgi:hypothetical protein